MKLIQVCCMFCMLCEIVFAQSKMNLTLHKLSQENFALPASVLVQGDITRIRTFVETNNGTFICNAGDIASVEIPRNKIAALASQDFVVRIEAVLNRMHVLNDTMRVKSHVEEVHLGTAPLMQPYGGEGVLMGLIDAGIDLAHPDFRDSLNNTRVKWLWDMTKPDSANTPVYGYGQEWSDQEINAGTCTHTGQDQFGHGSYVAGIAAGDGSSVGHFQGVAPASDMIVVAYDFVTQDTTPRLAHAVDYIFAKATLMGKPCVINISIGDYYGSHDGLDLQSQFISNLINQQCGRIVVAGSGDIGTNYAYHLGYSTVPVDTTFTWFKFNPSIGGCYIQVFSDVPDFSGVSFAVGADKVTPYYHFRGRTPFHTAATWGGGVHTEMLMSGANRIGIVQSLLTIASPGVYSLEYFVVPDSTDYHWRFITTGSGSFDSWSFDWVFQNLPDTITYPDMVNYHTTDTNYSMVSGLQCLDNVIAVGQYFNTDRHVDVNGVLQVAPGDVPDALAPNSGRGPTRDGRIKPDICAPGNHIISCGVLAFLPGMISAEPHKVAQGGYHITGGGTSASSPVVAGIGALFLQQNPTACWQDFKASLLSCAYTDNFTWGPVPNNSWGYGKAHAFNTLTACSPVSVTELGSGRIEIYPNPASESFELEADASMLGEKCVVEGYDFTGKKLFSKNVSSQANSVNIEKLTPGVYQIFIRYGEATIVKRLIKL